MKSLFAFAALTFTLVAAPACDSVNVNHQTRDIDCSFTLTPLPGIYREAQTVQIDGENLASSVRYVLETPETFPSRDQLQAAAETARPTALLLSYLEPLTLDEGLHRLTVFDPCRQTWSAYHYVIDQSPPTLSISPDHGLYRPPLTVNVNALGADLIWARMYRSDQTAPAYAAVTGPLLVVGDGEWRVEALASDLAGNVITASAALTTNSLAPIIVSVASPGGLDAAARFPRFELRFDQNMATTTTRLTAAFAPRYGDSVTDGMLFWQSSRHVFIYPLGYLQGATAYELRLAALANTEAVPVSQLQNGLSPTIAFSTRDSAPQGVRYGSIAVTSPVPLLLNDAQGALTIYASLSPPPFDAAALTFLTFVTDRVGQPALDFPDVVQLIASTDAATLFRLQFNGPRAWPNGQVAALAPFAVGDNQEYSPKDYLGVYVAPPTLPSGATLSAIASGGVATLAESARQAYLRFDAVPNAASFSQAITAERIRAGARSPIEPSWDYLGMSGGVGLRLHHNADLAHGDLVVFYVASPQLTGIAGGALAAPVTAPLFYSALSLSGPQQFRHTLNQWRHARMLADTDLLSLLFDRADYTFGNWRIKMTAPLPNVDLPLFVAASPAAPNRNGPAIFRVRTLPDVDPLPDSTVLELELEIVSVGGASHTLTLPLQLAANATVVDGVEPLGSCSAARNGGGLAAIVNCGLRTSPFGAESLFFDVFDVLAGVDLQPSATEPGRYKAGEVLADVARGQSGVNPTLNEGSLVGEYLFPDQQRFVLRSLELLPTAATPTIYGGATTTAGYALPLTFAIGGSAARIDSYGLQLFSAGDFSRPLLDLRQPGTLPGLNLPAGLLPAGEYAWFVYGVSVLADPYNPFTAGMYDLGFAVSATAPLSVLP